MSKLLCKLIGHKFEWKNAAKGVERNDNTFTLWCWREKKDVLVSSKKFNRFIHGVKYYH